MSSQKCPQCGLTNFANDSVCKRCNALLELRSQAAETSPSKNSTVALLSCPVCKAQVSSQAPSCPKCGQPIASSSVEIPILNQNVDEHSSTFHPERPGASNPMLRGCLIVVAVFFGISVLAGLILNVTESKGEKQSTQPSGAANVSSNETGKQTGQTSEAKTIENNTDYKAGYKQGFRAGVEGERDLAQAGGGTMFNKAIIHGIAMNNVESSHASDKLLWVKGWEAGYVKGFEKAAQSK